ncbi:hypothetical protein [Endozoicomonas sp. ALC066]|uniref:hypothetical protein n=1 Tax=Endozoicomonas sp. ALC066 TaxID=3403078 RepID=UPI003BB5FA71
MVVINPRVYVEKPGWFPKLFGVKYVISLVFAIECETHDKRYAVEKCRSSYAWSEDEKEKIVNYAKSLFTDLGCPVYGAN